MSRLRGLPLAGLRAIRTHLVHAAVCVAATTMATAPALAARPKTKIEAPGEVTVMSLTTGADVEIDGKPVGTIPLPDTIVLLPGKHTIKVTKRGYTEYADSFEVRAGETVELEIDLLPYAGTVRILSTEPGASVKVDGKVLGTTPFDMDIPAGRKVITVSSVGFHDDVRELDIKAGEAYDIQIQLRPVTKKKDDGGEAFYETWWFWTIIGVAGVGAATAVVATQGGETITPTPDYTLNVP